MELCADETWPIDHIVGELHPSVKDGVFHGWTFWGHFQIHLRTGGFGWDAFFCISLPALLRSGNILSSHLYSKKAITTGGVCHLSKIIVPAAILRGQYDGIARYDGLIEFFGLLPNPDKE